MYMKMLSKLYKVSVMVCLIIIALVYSAQAEQGDLSLYSHVMNMYSKSYVDVSQAENKLVLLQEEYNVAKHANLQVESFEALKDYAITVEQDINIKIDEEVEHIKTSQNLVVTNIERNIGTMTTKELSVLNREYIKYKEDIDKVLKDKTSMASMFSEYSGDIIDVSELETSIKEQENILSYNSNNNNTYLGELKDLKIPFNYSKRVTSNAGYRTDPITGEIRYHNATDYALPVGTELYSVFNGTITKSDNLGDGYGESIKVDCGNGIVLHYAHLSKRHVEVGDTVSQNQIIGLSGNTGRSTGPHLHLSLFYKGEVLDIERLFK